MNPNLLASTWREEHGYTGGVVVIYDGEVCGWVNELRDPQSWRPGCIAVAEDGTSYVSVGGDWRNGAEEWVQET